MQLTQLNIGCFGGGTGLPSLIGGLKQNPWIRVNAVVTTFDSGGSSGQLRDQVGVLPPGDVLRCALALARNESEARRVLLSRLPALENGRLGGHTGGNLLLSMMERCSGDFLAAVDSLCTLLDCCGRVWPVSVQHASVCAEYEDGSRTSGEVAVDAEQTQGRCIKRIWLDPEVTMHPAMAQALRAFDAVVIGPGSFYTSLMPTLLVKGVAEELQAVKGPVMLVANFLTEGRGMHGFSAGEAARRVGEAIGRPVDVAVVNSGHPPGDALGRYAAEHKELLPAGDFPPGCEVLTGRFWHGPIARHERQRLAYAVWSVLARRLLA